MKNRGVIIAIILILIMGAGVTAGTKRFISDKTSGSPMPVLEEQASPSSGQGMESMPVAAAGITTFSADGEAGELKLKPDRLLVRQIRKRRTAARRKGLPIEYISPEEVIRPERQSRRRRPFRKNLIRRRLRLPVHHCLERVLQR